MGMIPFHTLFPAEARNECRTITPINQVGLPNHTFLLMELYCSEPQCDCRRVLLNVIDTESGQQVATISHGFEPPAPPHDDEDQTFLDPLNLQSAMSAALLRLFEEMIARDEEYGHRLERHYTVWKSVVNDPFHPDQVKLGRHRQDVPGGEAMGRRREPDCRTAPKVGANDPCPCGSGRKFKRCCRT
jgi:hypothetical protein